MCVCAFVSGVVCVSVCVCVCFADSSPRPFPRQMDGDPNGQYTDMATAASNQNAINVVLPRQCALYYLKTLSHYAPATPWDPPPATICPIIYGAQSFYLRSPPASPDEVNGTALTERSVEVEWRLRDTGGCVPVTFRVQLFAEDREPIADANVTFPHGPGEFPVRFSYTLALPPALALRVDQDVFVGVTASNEAGALYPGTSRFFSYGGPVRLGVRAAAGIVGAVIGGACLLVCAVGCCYRRCISVGGHRYQSV